MTRLISLIFLPLLGLVITGATADTITTHEGATLVGRITVMTRDTVIMETTYAGKLTDIEDFLLTQDSGLTMPLGGTGRWGLRLGLENRYANRPAADREKLDTTWYSRLQMNFN